MLTNDEIQNTTASWYDVEYQYFVYSGYWAALDTTLFTPNAVAYVPEDANIGYHEIWFGGGVAIANWTDVTAYIHKRGRFNHQWQGSSVSWTATLNGQNYSETYFGVQRVILCVGTRYRGGNRLDVKPIVFWLGQIVSGTYDDNFQLGGQWSREIGGVDASLMLTDAPRISVGPIDITSGVTPTVSSTLATPATEAGNGEFVGSTANVGAANITDANLNTVWISQDIPTSSEGEDPVHNGDIVINEAFFKPAPGYPLRDFWWIELFNASASSEFNLCGNNNFVIVNEQGQKLTFYDQSDDFVLRGNGFGVICQNRALFETYTGGAANADFVVEAMFRGATLPNGAPTNFILNANGGFLQAMRGWPDDWSGGWSDDETLLVYDAVVWNKTGAASNIMGWTNQAAVNVNALTAGQSIGRYPSGSDTGTNSEWTTNSYPVPGGYIGPETPQWALFTLPESDCTITASAAANSASLAVSDVRVWPANAGVSYGIIDSTDTFSYTGVNHTGAALTGVVGVSASHAADVLCRPLVDDLEQTGWPVEDIYVARRPGLSTIKAARVYTTQYATSLTPDDAEWWLTYDTDFKYFYNNSSSPLADFTVGFGDRDAEYRFARRVLLVIDEMSDGGRAKINEVKTHMHQSSVTGYDTTNFASLGSAEIARYLLVDCYGLDEEEFLDLGFPLGNVVGSHAIAIAPYTEVLDDLARVSGALVYYGLAGEVEWRHDPWFPWGAPPTLYDQPRWLFQPTSIRGNIHISEQRPTVDGVIVNGVTPNGTNTWRATWGDTSAGAQTKEFNGYVAKSELSGRLIAEMLFYRENHQRTCEFTVAGLGEWCEPGDWIDILWDFDGDGTREETGWITESVTRDWSVDKDGRSQYSTRIAARQFRKVSAAARRSP